MPNGHGGYRAPNSPAPVSGPGALSQRTDGGPADSQPIRRLPNAGYGESAEFEAIQAGAPVAQKQPIDTSGLTPLDAPTRYPERPITDGADAGMGAPQPDLDAEDLLRLGNYLPELKLMASQPYATNALRQFVRQLASRQAEG